MVSSAYFDAIGARLLEGRPFTPQEDLAEDERVVIIDEKLARRIAPAGSAIDAVIGIPLDGAAVDARVVGVVEHVRHQRIEEDGIQAVYVPYRQEASRDVSFVVRTDGDPAALAPDVNRVVQSLDPELPVYSVRTLDEYVSMAIAPRSFGLRLLLLFALLAVTCTGIGLYGVVAYDVGRRTREIGIRIAVGASRTRIVRTLVTNGARVVGAGVVAGVAIGALAARSLAALTYGVGPADPLTWLGALGIVAGVGLAGTWLPALRASQLEPREALRSDG